MDLALLFLPQKNCYEIVSDFFHTKSPLWCCISFIELFLTLMSEMMIEGKLHAKTKGGNS